MSVDTWNIHAAKTMREYADTIAATPALRLIGEENITFADLAKEGTKCVERLTRSIDHDRSIYLIWIDDFGRCRSIADATGRSAGKSPDMRLPKANLYPYVSQNERVLYVGTPAPPRRGHARPKTGPNSIS